MEKNNYFENSFAKSIVELKLASDRIAECGVGGFTVKYQMLFLIANSGQTTPSELIYELNMAKSNLALLAKKMIGEGLIEQTKEKGNKKQIYYTITEKGMDELSARMKAIDNSFSADKEMLKKLAATVDTLKKLK